eukprot:256826-Chlamydomonas_euryale.AAC.2
MRIAEVIAVHQGHIDTHAAAAGVRPAMRRMRVTASYVVNHRLRWLPHCGKGRGGRQALVRDHESCSDSPSAFCCRSPSSILVPMCVCSRDLPFAAAPRVPPTLPHHAHPFLALPPPPLPTFSSHSAFYGSTFYQHGQPAG